MAIETAPSTVPQPPLLSTDSWPESRRTEVIGRFGGLSRHLSWADGASILLTIAAFSLWIDRTSGLLTPRLVACFTALALSTVVWGRVLLVALAINRHVARSFPLTFLTGAVFLACGLAAIRLVTPWSLDGLFWVQALVGFAVYAWNHRALARWQPLPQAQRIALAATTLCLAATTLWLRHLIPLAVGDGDMTYYRPMVEFFFHATHTTPLLIDGTPIRVGAVQFAGVPLSYYHYASYVFPALLTSVGGCPVYEAMVGCWYPLGFYLLGLAVFSLGTLWFRKAIGFWCVVAVLVIPDPFYWCTPIKIYAFDAYAEGSPALSYATAATLLATILMTLGVWQHRLVLVAASMFVALATVFFKANILLAAAPFCGLFFLVSLRHFRRRTAWLAVATLIVVGLAGLLLGTRLRSAPTIGLDPRFGAQFVNYVFTEFIPGDSWLRVFPGWIDDDSAWIAIPSRAKFLLVVTYQGMLPAITAVFVASLLFYRRFHWLHALLLFVWLIYLASAICLPPNQNGDPYELQHRSYFWVYAFGMLWMAGLAMRMRDRVLRQNRSRQLAGGFLLLLLPAIAGLQLVIPPKDSVPTGLVDCGRYVARQSRTTDIVQASDNDPHLVLAAISQRRAYICIALDDPFPGSGALRQIHETRAAEVSGLVRLSTTAEIADWSRRTGVRWFVLAPEHAAAWPTELLRQPAFASHGYRAYDLDEFAAAIAPAK